MKSKLQNLSFAVLGLAVVSASAMSLKANADEILDAAVEQVSAYDCLYDVCVGDSIRVVGGRWMGHGGRVVGVDARTETVTAINGSNLYIYPSLYDVQVYSSPQVSQCVSNVCVGDQVRILSGRFRQYLGRVVSVDRVRFTAAVVTGNNQTVAVSVRNLSVLNHAPPRSGHYDPRRRDRPQRRPLPGQGSGRVERRGGPVQSSPCPIGTRPNPRVGGRCTAT